MDEGAVKACVETACREVEKNDFSLLADSISEWAVAHRLAFYLEKHFPDYHVDCEYNRMPKNASATYAQDGHVPKRLQGEQQVRPDIVIHRRGENANNLLVIELKKATDIAGLEQDREKLKAFMTDQNIHYKMVCQVTIRKTALTYLFI